MHIKYYYLEAVLMVLVIYRISIIAVHGLKCKCEDSDLCLNFDKATSSCEIPDEGSFCFSSLVYSFDHSFGIFRERRVKGCAHGTKRAQTCVKVLTDRHHPMNTLCCESVDFCNGNLYPHIEEIDDQEELLDPSVSLTEIRSKIKMKMSVQLICVAVAAVCTLGGCYICVVKMQFCQKHFPNVKYFSMETRFGQRNDISELNSLDAEKERSINSMSSAVGFILSPLTLGKELDFLEDIGEGGFSFVHRGMRKGMPVAIKIAKPPKGMVENPFKHETAVYMTPFFQHENVLRYISSDTIIIFAEPKHVMVMEYHENGSLYQYLKLYPISRETLMNMVLSISLGLEHLHEAFHSKFGRKFSIAHRDLKCTNILVKKNLECCIADFGSAVVDSKDPMDMHAIELEVGTTRYMAPEILNRKLNTSDIRELVKADIYAFGLLLWEMANSYVSGVFNLAFHDLVSAHPTIQEMREVACEQRLRPSLVTKIWKKDFFLKELSMIIPELWSSDPAVRSTAFYVRKRIQKMQPKSPEPILSSEGISCETTFSESFLSKFWIGREPLASA